jgi:hypothetical protein
MSVQSDLVRETIVNTISERALARADTQLPEPVASALDLAEHPELARTGYFARIVETELFEPARTHAPGLAEELHAAMARGSHWTGAVAELAALISGREPLERPDPDDADAFSWRVPGPGGHVRHYVALRLIGRGDPALKRDVIYGFALRCCEEVSPARAT